MVRYIGKRLLMMIPIILGISLIILIMIDLTPGDPARQVMGFSATEEQLEEFREVNGLNDPFIVRYGRFLFNAVRGDLGTSYVNHRTVWSELMARFPYTLFLSVVSMALSLVVGIPLWYFCGDPPIQLEGQRRDSCFAVLRVHAVVLVLADTGTALFCKVGAVAGDGH